MSSSEESPFDDAFDAQLRARLADAASTRPLPPGGLTDVRARLAAAGPTAPPNHSRPFAGGVAVGVLLMLIGWWGSQAGMVSQPSVETTRSPQPSTVAPQRPTGTPLAFAVETPAPRIMSRTATVRPSAPTVTAQVLVVAPQAATMSPSAPMPTPRALTVASVAPSFITDDSTRGVSERGSGQLLPVRWTRAGALDTALRYALIQPETDTSRAARQTRRAHLYALFAAEAMALAGLQASFDSLKVALPEAPPALPVLVAAPAPPDSAAPADAWRYLPPARSPWALAALLETTPSWSTLPVHSPRDEQEHTQASLSQSIQAQRQIGNRWLVRAGLGQLTTQTQVRRTAEHSENTIVHDSSQVTDVVVRLTSSTTEIVHLDSVMLLDPITNLSGQIVDYDTTWAYTNDTLRSTIIGHDTLRSIRTVHSTRTETWRVTRQQLFRPTYRFWIIPLSAQYQLVRTNRWTLGLNMGGQLTVFRGGTRPVWTGEDYAMQRIGPREGPYRPVSFSISAGLEAAYRLSPRLTALVAPTGRWWAVAPGKTAATRTQPVIPGLQVGLAVGF